MLVASVSAVWKWQNDPLVAAYCASGPQMRHVVLRAKDEEALKALDKELDAAEIRHVTWIEHPENIITAIALVPCSRGSLGKKLRRFPLFK